MKLSEIKKQLGEALVDALTGDGHDHKVEKTVPMKKTWKKLWDSMNVHTVALTELREKEEALKQKHSTAKKLFWSTVETELGIFDRGMRFNPDTNEIEVLEKCEDNSDDNE